jgi:hypothetical protein
VVTPHLSSIDRKGGLNKGMDSLLLERQVPVDNTLQPLSRDVRETIRDILGRQP